MSLNKLSDLQRVLDPCTDPTPLVASPPATHPYPMLVPESVRLTALAQATRNGHVEVATALRERDASEREEYTERLRGRST